jgi:hypothetical protein
MSVLENGHTCAMTGDWHTTQLPSRSSQLMDTQWLSSGPGIPSTAWPWPLCHAHTARSDHVDFPNRVAGANATSRVCNGAYAEWSEADWRVRDARPANASRRGKRG